MKNNLLIILTISLVSICILSQCKKEPIRLSPSNSNLVDSTNNDLYQHFSGKFYIKVVYDEIAHCYNTIVDYDSLSYDQVIDVSIDSIWSVDSTYQIFLNLSNGYSFRVDSANQTSFTGNIGPTKLSLSFYQNYDSLSIDIDRIPYYPCNNAYGPKGQIMGSRSTLRTSASPHTYNANLEGNYRLSIHKIDGANQVDTMYTDSLFVSSIANDIHVGTESIAFNAFHSFYTEKNYPNEFTPVLSTYKSIYWADDSLYLEYKQLIPNTTDTIYYRFEGVK